jgi:hypothetical protein
MKMKTSPMSYIYIYIYIYITSPIIYASQKIEEGIDEDEDQPDQLIV